MSNERQLLKEIMSYFAKGDITIRQFENSADIAETLYNAQELLAQPEYIPDVMDMVERIDWLEDQLNQIEQDLYPKRESLSDETIAELWGDKHSGKTFMVRNFARAIEKELGKTGVV
jgi:polynucleotide 5'-kinase involved in rRNA processing